jgi:integrase
MIDNATTKRTLILYLTLLFNHAKSEEAITANPMDKVPRPKVEYSMPAFMPPEHVAAILAAAEQTDTEIVPRLAIGFFAGLRSCELDRLTWGSCKLDEGIITVTHTKTSSGHMQSIPRHVTISDNLRRWIEKYRKEADDPIGPHGKRLSSKRGAIAKVSGFAMIENGARHTFATMHMAKHKNADALAAELGHMQGVRVLFRHYRGLATAAQAEVFWAISPQTMEQGCAKGMVEHVNHTGEGSSGENDRVLRKSPMASRY